MTAGEWLPLAEQRLVAAGIESEKLEAQLLAAHCLGIGRAQLLSHLEMELPELAAELLLQKRETREPLAYILGRREFFGYEFRVSPGVLIPRQETECLVDAALDLCASSPEIRTVLDLGTGSGCIAICLALQSKLQVTGIDKSEEALKQAALNSDWLHSNVEWMLSDQFSGLNGRVFDLIVSNPPYIREDEILMPEVAEFEPKEALFAGEDGLDAYRWIAQGAADHLNPGGHILLEIGIGMAASVIEVLESANFEFIRSVKDLSWIERVLVFRRSE